ncbi:MAG: phenylalanine--tRNA ligase subunit beta [Pseudomonadota bacterium]
MKFTLSWLKRHLKTTATLDEITYALTDLGLEVEGIDNPVDRLKEFTVGHVKKVEKHSDADRLNVCMVETGEGDKQIICGAPNVRAGMRVVVAQPGMYVPGIDTTIRASRIRGIESHGMMCSEREMELSDAHDGIIELPGTAEVGMRFVDWLSENDPARVDPVIKIAITPDRPDALGVAGIARDLAARGLGRMISEDVAPVAGDFPSPIKVTIDANVRQKGCPIFCGRFIRGVKNGPSPAWLQQSLRAIGLRPISALVDITNFYAYDRNRPLHVFDADKVKGDLRVHFAKGGERIESLDEKVHVLASDMMAISDEAGPQAIAGIMGGAGTGCTEQTVNVFLESAYWDPVTIARTGRGLKINSDAGYRFERGVDPAWTRSGIDHATKMILELCGGEASEIVIAGAVPDTSRVYRFDTARVQSLVGMRIDADAQRRILTALGFRLEGEMVHAPSWRPDITNAVDLVEEVVRVASLTKLQSAPLSRMGTGASKPISTPMQRRERVARRMAATLGYHECITYSFIDENDAMLFGGGDDATRLENPLSGDMSHMRPALLPGLLRAAARNQARGFMDMALFEIGPVFHGGTPGEQGLVISGLLIGHTGPKDAHGARRPVDVFDVKADAEALLAALGAPARTQILRRAREWWHPGRHGTICLGPGKVLAVFGELHPKVLTTTDVKGPVMAFTLWPAAVPFAKAGTTLRPALRISDLQAVERDFAFVVDAGVEATTLVRAAASADKALIDDVRVFDELIGGIVGENKKSLAIAVRLQPYDKTLTEDEIEAVSDKIIEKVTGTTGGTLRR